jgi:transaldolase
MKIFVATSDLDEIQWASQTGLIDGILLPREFPEGVESVVERVALPVCVGIKDPTSGNIVAKGREVLNLFGDQTSVWVPFGEDTLDAIRQLHDNGVRVVASSIVTPAQAMLAAKMDIWAVGVDVDRLNNQDRDGEKVVRDIREVFDQHGTSCDVLAVSRRDAQRFARCARAGADIIGVEPDLLRSLLVRAGA